MSAAEIVLEVPAAAGATSVAVALTDTAGSSAICVSPSSGGVPRPRGGGDRWTAPDTVRRMTEQQSRWSLAHTGNRVLVAVLIGLVVSVLIGMAGVHGTADLVVFVLTVAIAYGLVTVLHRAR
jgi:hypothetical protein